MMQALLLAMGAEAGAGAGVNNPLTKNNVAWNNIQPGADPIVSTFSVQTNGNITGDFGTGGGAFDYDDWYLPNTVGIGTSYWVRFTRTAGSLPCTNTGLWRQLNFDQSCNVGLGASPTTGTADLLIEISTSATGTPVVASGTYLITHSDT